MLVFIYLVCLTTCFVRSYRPRLVDDDICSQLYQDVANNVRCSISHDRTVAQRSIYDLRKKYDFFIKKVRNIVSGNVEERFCLKDENGEAIIYP